jgi:hypothetical protein
VDPIQGYPCTLIAQDVAPAAHTSGLESVREPLLHLLDLIEQGPALGIDVMPLIDQLTVRYHMWKWAEILSAADPDRGTGI